MSRKLAPHAAALALAAAVTLVLLLGVGRLADDAHADAVLAQTAPLPLAALAARPGQT